MITAIDSGLEQLLRRSLPLPADLGDISFTAPDRSWGAQLSRVTVNLFLFDITRSPQPPRAPAQRTLRDGAVERRPPMPLVQLSYLVTAWAGNTSDEHQLLGDVLRCLLSNPVLPPADLPRAIEGSVQLSLADRNNRTVGDLWSALDARPRPAFQLDVTAALEAPWEAAARPVERIESLVAPRPDGAVAPRPDGAVAPRPGAQPDDAEPVDVERDDAEPGDARPPLIRRRAGGAVITESRPERGA